MREILFRGKRMDNGEWYYGSYLFLHVANVDWTGKMRGKPEDVHFIINDQDINYAVDPDTVGQFTGLLDKNGKRIFEGDIVVKRTYNGNKNFAVSFGGGMFHCGYGGGSSTPTHRYTLEDKQIRVIGNIHDNPELLKGGGER